MISQPTVRSPEIDTERRVTFRINFPEATQVVLMAEFLDKPSCLEKDAQGVWSITVGPLAPEIYHYSFIVDGVKLIDPANPLVKTGATARTLASILEIPGPEQAIYEAQQVEHGEVHTHWYYSEPLEATRRVMIYVPPHYRRKNAHRRYPVLYLLHGANGDESAWYRFGHVNLICDNMLARELITPFIVVMPFAYGISPDQADDYNKNTEMVEVDLLRVVIPFVEQRYSVANGAKSRAIIGQSRGGGQAITIGLRHIDKFGFICGIGSSNIGYKGNLTEEFNTVVSSPDYVNERLRLLWLFCAGTDCGCSVTLAEFLRVHGVRHVLRRDEGGHTWTVWRRHIAEVAPFLFK